MDIDIISKYAKIHGLGIATGINFASRKYWVGSDQGVEKISFERMHPGETISIAIGQGMLNVTPAELLVMISTVALRGKIPNSIY